MIQKIYTAIFISALFIFSPAYLKAQPNVYDTYWQDSSTAIVVDPYYKNKIDWDIMLTDKRVVGILHKATQGMLKDPAYKRNKIKAQSRGYKWGSYHLGLTGDPLKQADYYLNFTRAGNDEVLALDIESTDSLKSMSLFNAVRFIERIFEKTGRYPLLYCNNQVFEKINKTYDSTSIFSQCALWYSRPNKRIPIISKNIWKCYTLWQFSCELNCKQTGKCLYNVPGTEFDIDVNVYNGTKTELISKWPNFGK